MVFGSDGSERSQKSRFFGPTSGGGGKNLDFQVQPERLEVKT